MIAAMIRMFESPQVPADVHERMWHERMMKKRWCRRSRRRRAKGESIMRGFLQQIRQALCGHRNLVRVTCTDAGCLGCHSLAHKQCARCNIGMGVPPRLLPYPPMPERVSPGEKQ